MKHATNRSRILAAALVFGLAVNACEDLEPNDEYATDVSDSEQIVGPNNVRAEEAWVPVLIEWKGISVDELVENNPITASILNQQNEVLEIRLSIQCLSALNERASLEIDTIRLDPMEEKEISIKAEELPIRTANGIAQMFIHAEILSASIPESAAYSTASNTIYYRNTDDSGSVSLFDLDFAMTHLDGVMIPVELDSVNDDNESGRVVGMNIARKPWPVDNALDVLDATGIEGNEPVPQDIYLLPQIRFCTTWNTKFADTGFGEDHLDGPIGEYVDYKARYARTRLWRKDRNWAVVWNDYLDSEGCTPYFTAKTNTSYRVEQGTYMRTTNLFNHTYYAAALLDWDGSEDEWPTFPIFIEGSVFWTNTYYKTASFSFPGYNTININPSPQNSQTNAAAVLGQIFKRVLTYGMAMGERNTWLSFDLNKSPSRCGSSTGGGGYSGNGRICLNDEGNGGASVWKHILAHEFGHRQEDAANWVAQGTLGGYDPGDSPPALCDCGHIPGSSHCLQSREMIGASQSEGWAHFIATTAFNDQADGDGYFLYYKGIRTSIFPENIFYPPNTVVNALNNIQWMENLCLSGATDRGVEGDWLQFFWALYAEPVANQYSVPNINAVFNGAADRHWNTLNNKAADLYSAAKATRFANLGASRGVAH